MTNPNNTQTTQFNEGDTHENNRLGGIPQGINGNGQQNMVEEGETKLNAKKYIFSNTLTVDKDIAKEFYFPSKYIGKTFADVSKLMERPHSRRTNDSIEENAKKKDLEALMSAQELHKQMSLQKDMEKMLIKHPEFAQAMTAQQSPSPSEQLVQDPGMVSPGAPEGLPQDVPVAKMGGYQSQLDFGGNLLAGTKNLGLGIADSAMGMLGASNVVKDSDYKGTGSELARGFSSVSGKVGAAVLPTVANIVAPGSGEAVKLAQTAIGSMNPQDNTDPSGQQLDQFGNVLGQAAGLAGRAAGFKYGGTMNQMWDDDPTVPPTDDMEGPDNVYKGEPVGTLPFKQFTNVSQPPASSSNQSFGVLQSDGSSPLAIYPEQSNPSWDSSTASMSMNEVNDRSGGSFGKYDRTNPIPADGQPGPEGEHYQQSALNALGTYAPVAYNIGQGLFGKVNTLNPNDYMNNTKISNYRNNINPQLKASDEAFSAARSGLRNAGAGGGAYMANMQALHAQDQMSKAGIHANAENEYAGRQLQVDQINAARGDQNAQKRLEIVDYNNKAKAAKQKMLSDGISQIGEIANSDTQNKIGMNYAALSAPDMKGQFTYQNYMDYLRSKMNNKNTKGK